MQVCVCVSVCLTRQWAKNGPTYICCLFAHLLEFDLRIQKFPRSGNANLGDE